MPQSLDHAWPAQVYNTGLRAIGAAAFEQKIQGEGSVYYG